MSGVATSAPVTTHLSNLYLSGAAVALLSGPRAFTEPERRPRALAAAAMVAAVNVIAEVLLAVGDVDASVNRALGGVNTSDPVDGLFGLAGVAAVVALLPWRAPARS